MFHRATRIQPPSNHSSGESKVEFTSLVGRTMERLPSSKTSLQQLEALVGLAKKKSEERGVMDHPKQILHGDWHPKNLRCIQTAGCRAFWISMRFVGDAVAHELANAVLQVLTPTTERPRIEPMASGLHFRAGQQLTSAWRSRIGKAPPEGTWSMLPWLMIETIAVETVLPVAVWGEIPGIDVQEWIQAGAETAEWIRERSRSLAEAWIPTSVNWHSVRRRLAKGRAPTPGSNRLSFKTTHQSEISSRLTRWASPS